MKTTTLKAVVSLLFAMLISMPGMAQDSDVPASGESGVLVSPGTEADTTDARDELKAEVGEEQWLEAALLRYRNLKQRTDGLEAEWLKQFEATLARAASRIDAARKPSPGPTRVVSSTELTAAPQPSGLEERSEAKPAAATQSTTPLSASAMQRRPDTSLNSETLKCLKECLCQLENRVSQLEKKLAGNGVSVNAGKIQSKETQQ